MSDDLLQQIQSLQFSQKAKAEALLQDLIREMFALDVTQVELRPLAVSLNSFNGFATLADGQRLFFKTHTEPDSVVGEYYNSTILAEAGYPVIRPLYTSTQEGRQLLIYEVVEEPSVFDVAWSIETGLSREIEAVTIAQNASDDQLLQLYVSALEMQSAEDAAQARVHQLFYHRITGGRLEKFYGPLPGKAGDDVTIALPDGLHPMREVRGVQWIINGQHYDVSLNDLIEQAISDLQPAQAGPSVIGHGDAHNGNVFFNAAARTLTYFDPAFAGRHHPLLDLTKPLFHNVFAMWLYFTQEKAAQLHITLERGDGVWRVEHDYALHPVRQMFLESKVEHVLLPTLRKLQQRGWLRPDWRRYLKSALFCCPFLTMNLADSGKFPPEISLLGLTMAVEMGAESREKRSRIDAVLDQVEARL
jgi:hypothetical protein